MHRRNVGLSYRQTCGIYVCCNLADDSNAGAVAGAVIGVIVLLIVVAVIVIIAIV